MNVVGVDVVLGTQRANAFLQPFQRQAILCVYSGSAQDADAHLVLPPETAQLALGINASPGTRRNWPSRTSFVDTGSGTIAINTAGAYVNKALW